MKYKEILDISNELILNDLHIREIREYLEHNEWGIAFETLCSIIETEYIKIDKKIYERISKIGKELEFEETDWNFLRKNLI